MKHISRIILTFWIICGLAAGNAYSFAQSNGYRKSVSSKIHFKQSEPNSKGIYTECHEKHSDAILECENELEDDNDKLNAEPISFGIKNFEHNLFLAHYKHIECEPRSNSLNILYCVFRI